MNRVFGWLLRAAGVFALLLLVVTLGIAAALYFGAWQFSGIEPMTVMIDDESFHFASFNASHALIAAAVIVLVFLIVGTIVPLVLFGVALTVVAALSLAALAVGGVALLLFSPLILFGLLIWWLVRRSRRTTMAA